MSIYDELLLSSDQLTRLKQAQSDYKAASESGDHTAMKAAHQRAEQIRNAAGYSGGTDGSNYQLLENGANAAGYHPYEKMVQNYATAGMQGIAAGYQNTMAELQKEREAIEQESSRNQAAARSAVWSAKRLASDGMLTRGLENTGLADVITATTLNQAAANAYQALLERQDRLRAADLSAIDAKADALGQVADLQEKATSMLTEGYSDFYEGEAEREYDQQMDLQDHQQAIEMNQLNYQNDYNLNQQKFTNDSALSNQKYQQDSAMSKQEYNQDSALSNQKYQQDSAMSKQEHDQDSAMSKQEYTQDSALSNQKYQQDSAMSKQEYNQDSAMSKQEYNQDSALSKQEHDQDSALSNQEYRQDSAMSRQEHDQDSALSAQEYNQEAALEQLAHQFDIDLSKLTAEQKRQLAEQDYNHKVAIETLKNQWSAGKK